MTKTTITVGVPSAGHPKVEFVNSLVELATSGLIDSVFIVPRLPVHLARKRIAENFKTTHLLMIDDDMTFTLADVQALIDAKKEVVSGLYFRRSVNNAMPVVFRFDKEKGKYMWTMPPEKLSKVDGTSLAFTLVSKKVFDKVGTDFKFTEEYGEDLDFINRVRLAGIDIWLEPKARIGHLLELPI